MVVLAAVVLAAVPASARTTSAPVKASETAIPGSRRDVAAAGVTSRDVPRSSRFARATKKARVALARLVPALALALGSRPRHPLHQPLRRPAPVRGPAHPGPRTGAGVARLAARRRRPDRRDREPAAGPLAGRLDPGRPRGGRGATSRRPRGRRSPVLVAYNIPNRDCGLHSGGGSSDAAAYQRWIDALARGLGAGPAAVILEPDALAANCLDAVSQRERLALLNGAVERLTAQPGIAVYIDAGNPTWVPAARDRPAPARGGRRPGPRLRDQRRELLHHARQPCLRTRRLAPCRRGAVRHRHRSQRRRPAGGRRTGATRRAARSVTGRRPTRATAWWTPCCGSSAPASRTAPATAGLPPVSGGPTTRWALSGRQRSRKSGSAHQSSGRPGRLPIAGARQSVREGACAIVGGLVVGGSWGSAPALRGWPRRSSSRPGSSATRSGRRRTSPS